MNNLIYLHDGAFGQLNPCGIENASQSIHLTFPFPFHNSETNSSKQCVRRVSSSCITTFNFLHLLLCCTSTGVMAALLESKAVLTSRAKSHGLSSAEIAVLVNAGVDNLAKLAFSITTPGVNPGEAELRGLLNSARPNEVSIGSLASIRRLMFDAQTLAIQNIKSQVDGSDSAKRELVPAERSVRIADQKARLAGYDLTGPLECSFASYDICVELQEKDAVYYLAPHKFTTRSSEVIKDANTLWYKDGCLIFPKTKFGKIFFQTKRQKKKTKQNKNNVNKKT